ncbi:MAG: DUF47 domain-containing protein [Terriglobia bacterium]
MANVLSRLLPRERSFFALFTQASANLQEAASALAALFRDYTDVEAKVKRVKDLEHRGDEITHQIMTQLNQTFLTPFDREDIHALTSKLDDVLDLIDSVAARLVIYKVRAVRPGALEMASVLVRATEEIHAAVSRLEKQNGILERCAAINQMEDEGDATLRRSMARLFDEVKDPIELIKWKEFLEVLEAATDKCEDVADVLESVVVKNA